MKQVIKTFYSCYARSGSRMIYADLMGFWTRADNGTNKKWKVSCFLFFCFKGLFKRWYSKNSRTPPHISDLAINRILLSGNNRYRYIYPYIDTAVWTAVRQLKTWRNRSKEGGWHSYTPIRNNFLFMFFPIFPVTGIFSSFFPAYCLYIWTFQKVFCLKMWLSSTYIWYPDTAFKKDHILSPQKAF